MKELEVRGLEQKDMVENMQGMEDMAEDIYTTQLRGLRERNKENHPLRLLERAKKEGRVLFVQGPMVRYSKLPFRSLMRDYKVDLCYSPMILAKEFVRSNFARNSDFTTYGISSNSEIPADTPLVVQFGASNALDFARAAEMVAPYCDGVNLNCGCPQSWAISEGVGCALMRKPELVAQMVREAKKRTGKEFCISVKMRIHADLEETKRWVQIVEAAGPDYITVHGRTRNMRSSEPVKLDGVKLVKETASCPVIENGDVFSLEDVDRIVKETGVDGVMAARGLLTNPALFAGFKKTPWGAIERFIAYNMQQPIPFRLAQHHIIEMMENLIPKKDRSAMYEAAGTMVEMLDYLDERFVIKRPGEEGFGEAVEVQWQKGWKSVNERVDTTAEETVTS
ncbi:dihydrouridine synthase [Pyronema omphalodes]|nr:dihydrouridine synthase [Pyronema omphalodes]